MRHTVEESTYLGHEAPFPNPRALTCTSAPSSRARNCVLCALVTHMSSAINTRIHHDASRNVSRRQVRCQRPVQMSLASFSATGLAFGLWVVGPVYPIYLFCLRLREIESAEPSS